MAIDALQRRVFVDHHLFAFDHLRRFVAFVAGYVGVSAGQRQTRFIVVESRRLPSRCVMAVHAMSGVVLRVELPVVDVLEAVLAFL